MIRSLPGVSSQAPDQADHSGDYSLGSITHLQHQFAKHAITSKGNKPPPKGGVALPSFSESPTDELAELEDDLPPPTPPPPQPPVIHFEEHEKPASFKELRVECWHQLDFVCEQWKLVEFSKRSATPMISADNASTPSSSPRIPSRNSPDLAMRRSSSGARASPVPLALPSAGHLVLDLLQSTTEAVRSVQRFLLVHPDHDAALNARLSSMNPRASSMAVGTSLDQRHQSQLGISTAARPRTSMAPPSSSSLMSNRTASTSAQPVVKDDQINSVRKRCLELLGVLQHIEEKYRLESSEQAEEASLDNPDATEEASASGHLYKDVSLDDLIKEREVVKTWVQEVDELLRVSMMIGKDKNKKSSSEANSRASPDPSQFSEQLPSWARPEAFSGDQLRRAHSLLVDHIPPALLFELAAPFGEDGSREAFLESLSDGQLLCLSHNGVLKDSSRPWGFIPPEAIHDVIALNATERRDANVSIEASNDVNGPTPRVGMTFRRLENLRVWVASLKLRYEIHLSSSPKEKELAAEAASFDVKMVARREPGWQSMLEYALLRWVECVIEETRADHSHEVEGML